jgi:hypothetical protein
VRVYISKVSYNHLLGIEGRVHDEYQENG